jgi:hypothetical protein
MRMRQIVICGLSGSATFSYIIPQKKADFWGKKKNVIEHKMCILIFFANFAGTFFHSKKE